MSNTRHKIIIGIDYGTTFSGVSYVTTDKSDIDDITINSSWPGEQHAMWKTPTRIAYARENPQIDRDKWGFEVKPKHISYSWTKLLLDKNAIVGEHDDPALSKMVGSGMLQLPPFRLAVGVCEDFLHEVYVYISKKLRQQMTSLIFDSTPMECWITLPAIWSDEAKDATLVAAQRAGFGNRIGDEVFTIAEPEAAAIATLKKFSDPNALNAVKTNENILICDCGGGTVDITTYTITQTSPRLEFDELHVGIGGKCGATYIDRNLHTLLSERFGPSFDDLPFAQKGPGSRFMIAFETYKRDFGLSDDRDVREIGPIKLELPDSEHYDEEERMVKLTYEDMQTLFDPVVSQITSLISQQVKEIKVKRGSNIDRVVLVGGFAESPYLHNALENWCWQNGDITLIRPEHSQSAVVRGAALRGLEGIAPRMKRVRRHYGFIMGLPFREGIDPEEKAYYRQLSNEKLCDGRVKWLISKGDEVVQGTSRTVSCQRPYTPGREMVFEDDLYSSSLVDAPEHTSHPRADKVGVIKSIFPPSFDYGTQTESRFNTKLGKLVHEFRHEIQVVFGGKGSNLTFKNIVAGKVVSAADIQFDQR
ncbi:Hsp70 family protein-like protein [Bisporella sp. PMI_857]|nr:Hsp70 family protein-like protein [Bisporella sp. PMI_857]